MKRYKVYFYLGTYVVNPFITPKVVQVEMPKDETYTDNEVILEGLKRLGSYPKTYTARVEEVL